MRYVPRSENYAQMSSQEKEAFNEWLNANVVLSSIMAVGLVLLAIMGGAGLGGSESAKGKAETTVVEDTSPSNSSLAPAELIVPVLDRR